MNKKNSNEETGSVLDLVAPVLSWIISFFDPSFEKGQDLSSIFSWFMSSNWIEYFSDTTLEFFGECVLNLAKNNPD